MFTGLIQATGTIVSLTPPRGASGTTRITVSTTALAPQLHTGDSIAVNGVCLTALDLTLTQFSADLAEETVQRTTLSRLQPGARVNLELPTPAGTPLGGHVVQGHVDGVGTLISLNAIDPKQEDTSDWRLRCAIPSQLTRYVVPQGSITVEGISLTVADVLGDIVSIAIIPHTYASTTLHSLMPGAPINIEVDVLAKYAEAQASKPATTPPATQVHQADATVQLMTPEKPVAPVHTKWTVTEAYLLSNGY